MLRSLFAVAACAALTTAAQAAPIDGTFSYQGRLTNSGSPVTGMADLTFSLWDAGAGGAQIGADIVLLNVPVADGLFNVELDFGVSALDGEMRWLEIRARSPAGVGGYTTLSPRQPLLGTPYSIQTRGLFVDDAQQVGIGTTSPQHLLHVVGDANTAHAIYGRTTETVSQSAGVYGESNSTTGYGVFGLGTANTGTNYGVYGRTNSAIGRGVYGRAALGSGISYGVLGQSQSTSGTGVYGWASSGTGNTTGVLGRSDSPTGFAGRFEGRGYFSGFVGFGAPSPQYQVHAQRNSGTAIYGQGQIGVQGVSSRTDGRGVFGYASNSSGANYGVYGQSDSPDGYGGYFDGRGYFSGNVGIGTTNAGAAALDIDGDGAGSIHAIEAASNTTVFPTIFAYNNATGGSVLWAIGDSDASLAAGGIIVAGDQAGLNIAIDGDEIMARNGGFASTLHLNAEGGRINMGVNDIQPAFAYGVVSSGGTFISGSANITSTVRTGQGIFEVYFTEPIDDTDILSVTCTGLHGAGASAVSGHLEVAVVLFSDGSFADAKFSFVIYRP